MKIEFWNIISTLNNKVIQIKISKRFTIDFDRFPKYLKFVSLIMFSVIILFIIFFLNILIITILKFKLPFISFEYLANISLSLLPLLTLIRHISIIFACIITFLVVFNYATTWCLIVDLDISLLIYSHKYN